MSQPAHTSRIAGWRLTPAAAINGLGLYVLLMYGVTYYAVTTAAPRMASDFGVPASYVFAVLTAALLMTAIVAPRLGRSIDRIGAAPVLLVGSMLRAALLAAMAIAPEFWVFAIALFGTQMLGQATEYDATFAAAVDVAGDRARVGMSQITLWGGLASTVFWPVTAMMLDHMTWRSMLLVYAVVILLVCGAIAAALTTLPRLPRQTRSDAAPASAAARSGQRDMTPLAPPPFWLVAGAFAAGSVAYNLPSLMLPILQGLDLGSMAIVVGMLFGPSQTAGRFGDMVLGDRVPPVLVAVIATAASLVALGMLLIGHIWAALAFAVLFGAGAGVGYVVRGSVVLSLYGATNYAFRLGRLGTVRLTVTAMSPLLLVLILERYGAHAVIGTCAIAVALSLACFIALWRSTAAART